MRILLDESLPRPLARLLPEHDVRTSRTWVLSQLLSSFSWRPRTDSNRSGPRYPTCFELSRHWRLNSWFTSPSKRTVSPAGGATARGCVPKLDAGTSGAEVDAHVGTPPHTRHFTGHFKYSFDGVSTKVHTKPPARPNLMREIPN